jgi:hypothetical protein
VKSKSPALAHSCVTPAHIGDSRQRVARTQREERRGGAGAGYRVPNLVGEGAPQRESMCVYRGRAEVKHEGVAEQGRRAGEVQMDV